MRWRVGPWVVRVERERAPEDPLRRYRESLCAAYLEGRIDADRLGELFGRAVALVDARERARPVGPPPGGRRTNRRRGATVSRSDVLRCQGNPDKP